MLPKIPEGQDQQGLPPKRNLIITDQKSLKETDGAGLRKELIEGYNVKLPSQFQEMSRDMNDDQLVKAFLDGGFGKDARMITDNEKLVNKIKESDPDRAKTWGHDVLLMMSRDNVITEEQFMEKVIMEPGTDTLSPGKREELWTQDIKETNKREVHLSNTQSYNRQIDGQRNQQYEQLITRKKDEKRLGGVFDPNEIMAQGMDNNSNNQPDPTPPGEQNQPRKKDEKRLGGMFDPNEIMAQGMDNNSNNQPRPHSPGRTKPAQNDVQKGRKRCREAQEVPDGPKGSEHQLNELSRDFIRRASLRRSPNAADHAIPPGEAA